MSEALAIRDLWFGYRDPGDTLRAFDLAVRPGEMLALLGPSGCGKTTLLRLICGLLRPGRGDIRVNDRSLLGLPPEQREIAMVFQQDQLFEHLTVAENVAFGLRMRRWPGARIRPAVVQALEQVHMAGFADRRPAALSGGERQRIALARALVVAPRVMLLDEPLSALDASLREELRTLVRRLQQEREQTTLFVTHDQEEAIRLADRIAVLFDGRLHMVDSPRACFERPRTRRVAAFFGIETLVPARFGGNRAFTALGELKLAGPEAAGEGTLVWRPEAVRPGPGSNSLQGRVLDADYRGGHIRYRLQCGETALVAQLPADTGWQPEDQVDFHIPPEALWRLPEEE